MAFIHLNFFSKELKLNTDINIIIPTPTSDEYASKKDISYFQEGRRFQVLYLLHGTFGDYTEWCRQTSIERYAQKYKLAVVMPSCANSYYYDMYDGPQYLTYLTEELPRFLSQLFPFSTNRKDNFIAGLSMGGYGAWLAAISKPSLYAAAANLSGDPDLSNNLINSNPKEGPWPFSSIFENCNPDIFSLSENHLFIKLRNHLDQKTELPRLFHSIGIQDIYLIRTQKARERLTEMGVDITFENHPGIHDWDYWDLHIQRVLEWFHLRGTTV